LVYIIDLSFVLFFKHWLTTVQENQNQIKNVNTLYLYQF